MTSRRSASPLKNTSGNSKLTVSQVPPSPRGSIPPYQNANHNQYQSYNTSPLQHAILPQSPEEESAGAGFGENSLEPFPTVETPADYPQVNTQGAYQHHHNSSADSSISNPFGYPRAHQPQSSSSSNFHIPPSGLSSSPHDLAATAVSYGRHQLHSHSYSQPSFPTQGHVGMLQQQSQLIQHFCAGCKKPTPVSESFACTECISGLCRHCTDVLNSMIDRGSRCPKCSIGQKFKPFMLDFKAM